MGEMSVPATVPLKIIALKMVSMANPIGTNDFAVGMNRFLDRFGDFAPQMRHALIFIAGTLAVNAFPVRSQPKRDTTFGTSS